MACLDTAGVQWFTNPAIPTASGVFFPSVWTQANYESVPAQLKAFGYDCETSKTFARYYLDAPIVQLIKDGTVFPALNSGMFVLDGPTAPFTFELLLDGNSVGNSGSYDGSVFTFNTFAVTAGVDFSQALTWNVTFQGGATYNVRLNVPFTTTSSQSFDFDAWWCCASDCCAPPPDPQPPSRTGMQVLSNYTFQVNNSFGQVPKL